MKEDHNVVYHYTSMPGLGRHSRVAEHVQKPNPSAEEIDANKKKWGWTG